jgi:para-nitrobenzyl esterase
VTLLLTRRELISNGAVALGAAAVFGARALAADPAMVETANGRLQGLRGDGAVSFKGIPYAADTGGRNRFMAPRPVASWTGVREAVKYGDRCPGVAGPGAAGANVSENCCVLNVFTPDLNAVARRPVLIWFHPGAYESGSGEVDGSNLARFGDVVVVTVNHRLNVFGYANLADLHPDLEESGHVGQLDLIAALHWVKINIGAFSGDPQNTTAFGLSGGGSKIMTLQMMPRADGLFRRFVNYSGPGGTLLKPPSHQAPLIAEIVKVMGIDGRDVRKLQEAPAAQWSSALATARRNLRADQLRPVVDGRIVVQTPMSPEGLARQAIIPGIFSTTANEQAIPREPRFLEITMAQLRESIKVQYGLDDARAAQVVEGYRQDDPKRTPYEVLGIAASEALARAPMYRMADALSRIPGSRVYMMDFNYKPDPVMGAPHACDIPYIFGNHATGPNAKTGPDAEAVARNEMAILAAFARTGDPNNPRIPKWDPYNTTKRPTLVIDVQPRVVGDYRGGDRRTSAGLRPLVTFEVTLGK